MSKLKELGDKPKTAPINSDLPEVRILKNEGPKVPQFSDEEIEKLERPAYERRGVKIK